MRYKLAFLSLLLLCGCAAQSTQIAAPEGPTSETVRYRSGEDTLRGFLCHPAGEMPFPALVVIHGDFGLTDWVKEQAKRLAGRGFVVLAVDLYRGQIVSKLEDAHIMDRGLPDDRVYGDLKAAVDYLAGRADVRANALGVVGWDMGGGYALDAAMRDARLRAVVTCYGRPTTDAKLLQLLRASVFALFAGEDKGISPETIEQFRIAMSEAGKRLTIHVCAECGHGFLDPANWPTSGAPRGDDVKNAWDLIDNYLEEDLKR